MFSSFRHSIIQAKVGVLMGEKLLDDTEIFFKNTRALKKMINQYNPSTKTSNKKVKSHIY